MAQTRRRPQARGKKAGKSKKASPSLRALTVVLASAGLGAVAFLLLRQPPKRPPDAAVSETPDTANAAPPQPTRDGSPAWSPDGRSIIYSAELEGKARLHIIGLDGTAPRLVTTGAMSTRHPAFSPDGEVILFDSDSSGNVDIWAVDADGANLRNLTQHPARDVSAAFTPDGNRVVFISDRGGGKPALYVMPVTGGTATRLSSVIDVWFPQFSPDGKLLAIHSGSDIHTMNADGTRHRRLTREPDNGMHPSWSPDSRRIVFMSWRNGKSELFTMDADGANQTKLAGMPDGDAIDPRWSPVDDLIVFTHLSGGMSGDAQSLWLVRADGTGLRQLTGVK